jgi:oligoribonuclease NrnB/cAMP/cGMP phosphodiesterase (DHH superfamily)
VKQSVLIITDSDLDGCGSCLVLRWVYKGCNITNWCIDRGNPKSIFNKVDHTKFDKIYITDTYVPDDCKSLVDYENVYIVDHHKAHFEERDSYKKAKILMKEYYTSCTKLLYDLFHSKVEFSKYQKLLVSIIDDYDCFRLKYKQSRQLDSIYHELRGTNQDKLEKFIEEFTDGFKGFTQIQNNIINLRQKQLVDTIKECEFFRGKIDSNDAIVTFGGKFNNDIALYALKKYNVPVCIIVMPGIGRVSFRRSKDSDIDLLELCKKYCDGVGHPYAAGGVITDSFLELTKTFKKI